MRCLGILYILQQEGNHEKIYNKDDTITAKREQNAKIIIKIQKFKTRKKIDREKNKTFTVVHTI